MSVIGRIILLAVAASGSVFAQSPNSEESPPTEGRPIIVTGARTNAGIPWWIYYDIPDRTIVSMRNFGPSFPAPNYSQHPPISRPAGNDQVVVVVVSPANQEEATAIALKQSEAIARLREKLSSMIASGVKTAYFTIDGITSIIDVESFYGTFLKTDFVLTEANYGVNRAGEVVFNHSTGRYTSYINFQSLGQYALQPNLSGLFYYTLHEVGHVSALGDTFYRGVYRQFSDAFAADPKYRGATPYMKTAAFYRNEYGYFSINERYANNIAASLANAAGIPFQFIPTWGY